MGVACKREGRLHAGFGGRNSRRYDGSRAVQAGIVLTLGLALLQPGPVRAEPFLKLRPDPLKATSSRAARRSALESIPFDKLTPEAQAKVSSVLSNISFFRRMPIQVTQCDPDLYLFLVQHPDVVVNIWEVMGVTQMAMEQTAPTTFRVIDTAGTRGTFEYLYSNHDTHLIYTEGAYDGPLFTRQVKGRGLMLLKTGYVREPDGRYYITSRLDAFMRIENVGVELLTRTFSPLVGRVADINFTQSTGFLGSLSRSAEANPDGVGRLADRLLKVPPESRQTLAQLAGQVADKAARLAENDPARPPLVATQPTDDRSR